jgi:hypothetical protein
MVIGHIITEGTLGGQYEYAGDGVVEADVHPDVLCKR